MENDLVKRLRRIADFGSGLHQDDRKELHEIADRIEQLEVEVETLRGDLLTGNSELLDQAQARIEQLEAALKCAKEEQL